MRGKSRRKIKRAAFKELENLKRSRKRLKELIERLIKNLKSEDEIAREIALIKLTELAERDSKFSKIAFQALKGFLWDESAIVRMAAITGIKILNMEKAFEKELISLLNRERDFAVRRFLVDISIKIPSRRVLKILIKDFKSSLRGGKINRRVVEAIRRVSFSLIKENPEKFHKMLSLHKKIFEGVDEVKTALINAAIALGKIERIDNETIGRIIYQISRVNLTKAVEKLRL